jgi:hypothetical protein
MNTVQQFLKAEKDRKLDAAQAIVDAADRQGRSVTPEEKRRTDILIDEAATLRDRVKELDRQEELRANIEKMRGPVSDPTHGPARSFGGAVLAAGLGKTFDVEPGRLDIKARPTVELSAVQALRRKDYPDADTWNVVGAGITPLGQDTRHLFPNLNVRDAGTATAVEDFRVTDRTVTGNTMRAQDATTEKAKHTPVLEHVVTEIPQHAVVQESVPNALLTSIDQARQVLESEGRFIVEQSIDEHTYEAIVEDAPAGTSGTDIVAKVRNAVGAMRAQGAEPDLLVLAPDDAADLDLFEDGSGQYVFAVRSAGSSSPLWNLRVIEAAAADGADPVLVDSSRIGTLYLGRLEVAADPFSEFSKNLTSLRYETSALMHVRDSSGAFRIGAA